MGPTKRAIINLRSIAIIPLITHLSTTSALLPAVSTSTIKAILSRNSYHLVLEAHCDVQQGLSPGPTLS